MSIGRTSKSRRLDATRYMKVRIFMISSSCSYLVPVARRVTCFQWLDGDREIGGSQELQDRDSMEKPDTV